MLHWRTDTRSNGQRPNFAGSTLSWVAGVSLNLRLLSGEVYVRYSSQGLEHSNERDAEVVEAGP